MHQHSPGRGAAGDDFEMVGIQQNHMPIQNGDIDTQDDDDDDDSQALLRATNSRIPRHLEQQGPFVRIWPQIKDIVIESAPTLLMTSVSLLFTGKLLDTVSHWRAMKEVDQLIIIVPTVLNLNGNLEMNLSSRLGTASNVGELDDPVIRRSILIGSLALLQVQTISVSFIAACIALILGKYVPMTKSPRPTSNEEPNMLLRGTMNYLLDFRDESSTPSNPGRKSGIPTLIMVTCSTMTAACLSGLLLGSLMCTVIVLCRKYNRDPDNIAPAIASCLGDLFTLVLLGTVSTLLVPFIRTPIPFLVGALVVCLALSCLIYTLKNEHVRPLLKEGWSPLFIAMVISSGTGIVLDMFVSRYEGFALLAVVISGLPGAAGSILISRLSTALHAAALSLRQSLPSFSMISKHPEPSPLLTIITLLVITLPVELIFLGILHSLGWLKLPFLFVAFSIVFFCCAVLLSLLIARFLTKWLWSKNRDPDFYALPVHSAMMDLIGQLLLVLCFEIVSVLGGKVSMRT